MTQPSHPDDVTRARLIPPVPVAVAPMAGGPSTPELVAAVAVSYTHLTLPTTPYV